MNIYITYPNTFHMVVLMCSFTIIRETTNFLFKYPFESLYGILIKGCYCWFYNLILKFFMLLKSCQRHIYHLKLCYIFLFTLIHWQFFSCVATAKDHGV